jgi:hypothetical protein
MYSRKKKEKEHIYIYILGDERAQRGLREELLMYPEVRDACID